MNEFYETVANFLEELRCDSEERKYVITPDDMKKSDTELKNAEKANAAFGKTTGYGENFFERIF